MEIGIASASFGLILASLLGGPIAKFPIKRYRLTQVAEDANEPRAPFSRCP